MIVVDTSALIAILFGEPEARSFAEVIRTQDVALVAAPTLLEFVMVAGGRARSGMEADELLSRLGLKVVGWDERHLAIARDAFRRYGKGQGHGAALNFGDCMAYAVAAAANCPLLYKGDDFARTDISPAL